MCSTIIGPANALLRWSLSASVVIALLLCGSAALGQQSVPAEDLPRVTVPHHVDATTPDPSAKADAGLPSQRFGLEFEEELLALVLDPIDIATLRAEDAARDEPPLRVGVNRPLAFAATDGPATIQAVPGVASVWTAVFVSPGAQGLRAHFSYVDLPPGAELWVYGPQAPDRANGPYQKTGPYRKGEFWSGIVLGEELRVEYFLPEGAAESDFFLVEELEHLYRGLEPPEPTGGPGTREGPCHNDVMCYPDWHPLHNATLRILVNDGQYGYQCSATLLNTEASDETPYVLTAEHCVWDQAVAETLAATWFYQTESCDGPPGDYVLCAGADYLVGSSGTDETLVMILGTLPDGLTWSGWDTTTSLPNGTDVTCMSHPDGARKKITCGDLIPQPWNDPYDYWGIRWTSGTIEMGSSGSGLYRDDNHLLIGVASHSQVPIGCDNPDGPSGYGKFGRFYWSIDTLLEEGSDDALEDFDTCETALTVPSFPFVIPGLIVKSTDEDWLHFEVPTGAELTIDATFIHFNGDIDLELYMDCEGSLIAQANSNNDDEHLTFFNFLPSHDFYLRIFLEADTRNEYDLSIDVACDAPSAPTDVTASDGDFCDRVRISWTGVLGATGYTIWRSEIDDSATASQIGSSKTSPFEDNTTEDSVTYFYWVKTVNDCGESGFSESDSGYSYCGECEGDVDGDGDTDHSDLGGLLAAWCSHDGDPNWNPNADLDGDGHVGHGDLGILLADWGCGTVP